jgi:hypothetical protein
VEDMGMTEVDDTNMVEEHDHQMNYRLRKEGMNMVEEHYHPINPRLEVDDIDMVGIHMVEVEDMDMVDEQYHPMNHRSEVDGIDREDSDMVKGTPHFHVGTLIVRHGVACRRVKKRVKIG